MLSFLQKKGDIIFMFLMHVLGVGPPMQLTFAVQILIIYLAHRTLIVRKLKGLEDIIPYTSVHWEMLEKGGLPISQMLADNPFELESNPIRPGWRFAKADETIPGANVTPDPLHEDVTHLRDIYFNVNPDYEGRFTVPTLYDGKQHKIVSNEVSSHFLLFGIFEGIIYSENASSRARLSACSTQSSTR